MPFYAKRRNGCVKIKSLCVYDFIKGVFGIMLIYTHSTHLTLFWVSLLSTSLISVLNSLVFFGIPRITLGSPYGHIPVKGYGVSLFQ